MNRYFTGLKFPIFILIIVLVCSLIAAERGVVKVIPAPDYPYGLTYDGTYLWVGTSYANTAGDFLWKIDPSDGSVVGTIPVPDPYQFYKVKGLAYDGQYLWVFEDVSGTDKFFKVDPNTGAVLKTIYSPHNNYIGGMTFQDGHIWFSNYYGSSPEGILIKMDTTGVPVDTIVAQGEQPMGIAFDGQFLWCAEDSIYGTARNRIFQYDPVNLTYTGTYIRNPSLKPRDMTWDGNYLWLVSHNTTNSEIYQIALTGGTPDIELPVTSLSFNLVSIGDTLSYAFNVLNIGDDTLKLTAIQFDTSAFFCDVTSFPVIIPAGGSVTYHVSFAPVAVGLVTGTMTIHSNDPDEPVVTVSLSGQGQYSQPTIWLSAHSHDFGNVWIPTEGKARWTLKIANTGNQNLEIVDLILTEPVFTLGGFSSFPITLVPNDTFDLYVYFQPTDTLTYRDTLIVSSTDPQSPYEYVALTGKGMLGDYSAGYIFWNYNVPTNPYAGSYQEYEVDGLQTINDINGDGVDEVIIATENYWILCLDGNSSGTADTLWSFVTFISNYSAGSIGQTNDYGVQDAIDVASDLNGDGYNDVVIATGGGNEHVYAIDGTNGAKLWEYGTDDPNNYSLGDFEAVDARRDFTGDGVPDVLAIADGNTQGTGYKRAFLFNGTDGTVLWEYNYVGPNPAFGKTIISIDDVSGDGVPDAVIAVGNNTSYDLKTYCLDGATGFQLWEQPAMSYEPKELLELPVPGETPDVIVAEYFSTVRRLDGESGAVIWTYNFGGFSGMIQINRIKDVDGDGMDDILLATFTGGAVCMSGATGYPIWTWPMDFQYGICAVPDLNGDGVDDVIVAAGTNNPTNGAFYCISGKGDSLFFMHNFSGDRAHTVNILPSIDGNDSYELLVGTKFGQVVCFSGGLQATAISDNHQALPYRFELAQNYPNPFNPATTIAFSLPAKSPVTLKLYNILGQEVATLIDHRSFAPGWHRVEFNGSHLPSGVYIYRLESKFGTVSRKMILMK